jgi:hypothetical protein
MADEPGQRKSRLMSNLSRLPNQNVALMALICATMIDFVLRETTSMRVW